MLTELLQEDTRKGYLNGACVLKIYLRIHGFWKKNLHNYGWTHNWTFNKYTEIVLLKRSVIDIVIWQSSQ